MEDERADPNDAKEEQLAQEVLRDFMAENASQRGVQNPLRSLTEGQIRTGVAERLAPKLGRGDGDALERAERLSTKAHTKLLYTKLRDPSHTSPRELHSLLTAYVHAIRLDEQATRLFPERHSSSFGGFFGLGSEKAFSKALYLAAYHAAFNERESLEDTETQALVEPVLHYEDQRPPVAAGGALLAGWMAWRGRATYRFPFYAPKFTSRPNPVSNPRLGPVWHLARFAAYAALIGLPLKTMMDTRLAMGTTVAYAHDPRLAALQHQVRSTSRGPQGASRPTQGRAWPGPSAPPATGAAQENKEPDQGVLGALRGSRQAPPPPASETPQNDDWNAPPLDVDDASPIAPAARSQQSDSGAPGSAWARIRQQSEASSRQPPQRRWQQRANSESWQQSEQQGQQQGQQQQQQQKGRWAPSAESEWGASSSSAGTSPDYRGPRESFSFSSADEDRAEARSQEQREFDELVERERAGVDQGRSSWSRK